jgi:hypothetical protein
MQAKAREKKGGGTAEASIAMQVSAADGGGSLVACSAEVALTGRAAQSGRGIVEDVSKRMVAQMAECLNSRYGGGESQAEPAPAEAGQAPAPAAAPPPAQNEIGGFSLILAVIGDRCRALLRRLFGRNRKR